MTHFLMKTLENKLLPDSFFVGHYGATHVWRNKKGLDVYYKTCNNARGEKTLWLLFGGGSWMQLHYSASDIPHKLLELERVAVN